MHARTHKTHHVCQNKAGDNQNEAGNNQNEVGNNQNEAGNNQNEASDDMVGDWIADSEGLFGDDDDHPDVLSLLWPPKRQKT